MVREENVAKTCFVYRKPKPDKAGWIVQSAVLVDREIAIRVRKRLLWDEGAPRSIRQSGTNPE